MSGVDKNNNTENNNDLWEQSVRWPTEATLVKKCVIAAGRVKGVTKKIRPSSSLAFRFKTC